MSSSANPAYTSTASAAQIAARLRSTKRLVVITHAKPDGDASGSVLAVVRLAQRMGIAAEGWFVGPFPSWLGDFAGETPIRKLGDYKVDVDPSWGEPDTIAIVDTGSWVQLDQLRAWLETRTSKTLIVDHHLHGNTDVAALRLIDSTAASCTQVLAGVVDAALGLSDGAAIPREIADALYFGLATDTGWFRFSNATAPTFRLAARLHDSGVDAPKLYEMSEQRDAPARPRLLGRALAGMQWYANNTIGVLSLSQSDFAAVGAGPEDVGGFGDAVMSVKGVRMVAVFTEMSPANADKPLTKVSMRSKPGPNAIDVAAVCSTLGGGGHARAAGLKLAQPLELAKRSVLIALGVKP